MEGIVPAATSGPRTYTDFEPRTEWVEGEDSDTLLVDVAGFNKEQLKVQITTSGSLKISGERLLEGNQWIRFLKHYQVPKNSNPRGIQAKFDREEGLLFVVLPKAASRANSQGHAAQDDEQLASHRATSGNKEDAQREEETGRTSNLKQKFAVGFSNPKVVIASILVAVLVVMGIGIYFRYKLLRNSKGTSSN